MFLGECFMRTVWPVTVGVWDRIESSKNPQQIEDTMRNISYCCCSCCCWRCCCCCCFFNLPSILHGFGLESKKRRGAPHRFSQKKRTQQVIAGQSGVFSVGAPCFHPVTQNTMVPVGWLVCHIDHPMSFNHCLTW